MLSAPPTCYDLSPILEFLIKIFPAIAEQGSAARNILLIMGNNPNHFSSSTPFIVPLTSGIVDCNDSPKSSLEGETSFVGFRRE